MLNLNANPSPDNQDKDKDANSESVDGQGRLNQMIDAMEKARLAEYAAYLSHPYKLLGMNFLIGLARGLGSTLGLAVVLAGSAYLLKHLIEMNLPGISVWLQEMIVMIQTYKP